MDTYHVYPLNDILEHDVETDDCACLPHRTMNNDQSAWLLIHNAWDGRRDEDASPDSAHGNSGAQ
jgi:hypothetical protein